MDGWAEIVLLSSGAVALDVTGDFTGLSRAGFPLFYLWMAARDQHTTSYLTPQLTGVFCSLLVGWMLRMLSLFRVKVSEDTRAWDEEMVSC